MLLLHTIVWPPAMVNSTTRCLKKYFLTCFQCTWHLILLIELLFLSSKAEIKEGNTVSPDSHLLLFVGHLVNISIVGKAFSPKQLHHGKKSGRRRRKQERKGRGEFCNKATRLLTKEKRKWETVKRGEEVKREEMRKTVEKDAHRTGMLAQKPIHQIIIPPKYADILEVLAKVCHQRKIFILSDFSHYSQSPSVTCSWKNVRFVLHVPLGKPIRTCVF